MMSNIKSAALNTKQEKARNLRYRKAIVEEFNLEAIQTEMCEISEACDDVRYFFEGDDETLLNALDGDEDEEYEFKMMFSDLSQQCEMLNQLLYEDDYVSEYFDDFLSAVSSGSGMRMIGYDTYEEDYFKLTNYEGDMGRKEACKRICRLTKQEIVFTSQQAFGIVVSFLNIRTRYDSLKAAFDILRDENTSFIRVIKDIEAAYSIAAEDDFFPYGEATKNFDKLVSALPDKSWVE